MWQCAVIPEGGAAEPSAALKHDQAPDTRFHRLYFIQLVLTSHQSHILEINQVPSFNNQLFKKIVIANNANFK